MDRTEGFLNVQISGPVRLEDLFPQFSGLLCHRQWKLSTVTLVSLLNSV